MPIDAPSVEWEASNAEAEVRTEFSAAPELADKLREWLLLIFRQWKETQGMRKAPSWWSGGLLQIPFDFDAAKPYECTDVSVGGYGGLALKLLSEHYEPIAAVQQKVDTRFILAAAVLADVSDVPVNRSGLRASLKLYQDYRTFAAETAARALAPDAKVGAKIREANSANASRPRNRLNADRAASFRQIAMRLVRRGDESAEEIWPTLIGELDKLGVTALEKGAGHTRYLISEGEQIITFRSWETTVSRARQARKKAFAPRRKST